MENLNAQLLAAIITPWGLLDVLEAASANGKTVRYSSLCKTIPWEDTVIAAQFEATIKALKESKLIKLSVNYPNGMNISITDEGKSRLAPEWKRKMNDSFQMVDAKEKAPLNVPVQMLNLRGVAITDEILGLVNTGVVGEADPTNKSIGKALCDAWTSDAQEITHERKPTVMGWRYRDNAFIMVHTPDTNSIYKVSSSAADAVFSKAISTVTIN